MAVSAGRRTARAIPGDPRSGVDEILEIARAASGVDFSGYCRSVLEQRIAGRLQATGSSDSEVYLRHLRSGGSELGALLDALTIKVSSFFRDPLVFEYLAQVIVPRLVAAKAAAGDRSLRVWSAGCAGGEEPYSIAVLFHDRLRREPCRLDVTVIATDIDERALARGREALYPVESLADVRYGLLTRSFVREGEVFRVAPAVASLVRFATHDMLDPRTVSPAESVFGTFDLILCRNLLIYLESGARATVCRKLCRALAGGGYLVLGPAESLVEPSGRTLRRVTACRGLYRDLPGVAP